LCTAETAVNEQIRPNERKNSKIKNGMHIIKLNSKSKQKSEEGDE
jgi:hypothetical protein